MKFSKIAATTTVFSWVFMLIVGSFFIYISYNIVNKYQDNAEAKYEIELKHAVRNIFNNFGRTAGIEENSLAPLNNIFKEKEVKIICNTEDPSFQQAILVIDDNYDTNNNYLKTYPTFMTKIEQEKTDTTFIAVENLRMPFKVTNTLALISENRNLIIFNTQSQIAKDLEDKFSKSSYSKLNYKLESFSAATSFESEILATHIKNKNLNSVVFVTDSSHPVPTGWDLGKIEKDVQVIIVEFTPSSDGRTGEIQYRGRDHTPVYTPYTYIDYDRSMTLQTMAVFSNQETFECAYSSIFSSAKFMYDFYIAKAEEYENHDGICLSSFAEADHKVYYQNLKGALQTAKSKLGNNFDAGNELISAIEAVEQNSLTLEEFSCPYIY